MDIASTTTETLSQTLSLLEKPNQDTDGPTSEETGWTSPKWKKYNGYYRTNRGGTKAPIDKFAMWTVGKGFKADEKTKNKLMKIRGFGKDSFNSIMENQIRVKKINGDSFAEIIKDKSGKLINLKPLNPGRVGIITGENGIIKRYELLSMDRKKVMQEIEKEKMFHLVNDREADEIHGISVYESMEDMLDKIQQLDEDMTVVFHRFVVPLLMFKMNTDNRTKITNFKAEVKKALDGGEPMFIPDKVVGAESLKIPQFATLNPLDWRIAWKKDAIKDIGVPELVLGEASGITEASSKIVYLSYQQTIEDEQRETEEQLKLQLGIELEYEFPARIEENLGEDEGKDGKINTGKRSEVKITSEKVGDGGNSSLKSKG